jgi:hypothetical protein
MTNLKTLTWLIPFLLTSCQGIAFAGEILPIAFASFAEKDELYRSGQKALDEGRWNEAASIFGKVAERGGSDADAGLYWKAYAQHKAGRNSEALATIRQLASAFPKSAWLDDARVLVVEMGRPAPPEDEEVKLYALSGMMNNKPQRALPLVQQYLRGKHSLENKEKALFLLTQSELPQARQALLEIARGSTLPELRHPAIRYLANMAEDDREVVAELRSLLQSESDPKARKAILHGLANAEDVEAVAAAARSEKDPEVRIEAIHSLGNVESPKAAEALRSIYNGSADRKTRMAVIDALSNQENAKALIEIYRAEKDREMRREIVQRLAEMDSPEAEAFVDRLFDQN